MPAELHYLLFDNWKLKDIFSQVFSIGFISTYSEITIITIQITLLKFSIFRTEKKSVFQ